MSRMCEHLRFGRSDRRKCICTKDPHDGAQVLQVFHSDIGPYIQCAPADKALHENPSVTDDFIGRVQQRECPRYLNPDQKLYDEIRWYQEASIKIAIQKGGRLTDISRKLIAQELDLDDVPLPIDDRLVTSTTSDHKVGFLYAKTSDLPRLVAQFSVQMALVGNYQLIEGNYEDQVDRVHSYQDCYSWPLVFATPHHRGIHTRRIKKVATRYPIMTAQYLERMKMQEIEIIKSEGGTEMMAYSLHNGWPIDAIVDIASSGRTLRSYNLVPWYPFVGQIYPVLIANRSFR